MRNTMRNTILNNTVSKSNNLELSETKKKLNTGRLAITKQVEPKIKNSNNNISKLDANIEAAQNEILELQSKLPKL